MKYLLVGDYHIGITTNDKFLEYQKQSIQWAYDIAYEKNAHIVQLGDFVDKRTSIDFKILKFIDKECMPTIGQGITYLTGNHDTYYKNSSSISWTDQLHMLYENHDEYGTVIFDPFELNNILFVPWINDSNRDICLKAIKETKAEYCIGHFDIIGGKMSNTFNSPKGFHPKIFKKFKHVFSGHYHLNSIIDNIDYIGSICQLNWNDLNEKKYVYLFDSETGAIEKIENELQMFHEVHIDDDPLDFPKDFRKNGYSHIVDKHVKLYLHCERTVETQKYIDWFIDNNISVDVISKEIQLHNNEMTAEVVSNNIDENIDDGMKILLDDMDLTKSERTKIFDMFKEIQMESV